MTPPEPPRVVVAIDVGTSSARASLYDGHGDAVDDAFHQVAYEPRVTADGGVEHDAAALLDAVATCLDAIHAAVPDTGVLGVGVTTFWHGLVGFAADGTPLTPIAMWGDTRGAEDAAKIRGAIDAAALHARTGCHVHASYWPAKLRWLGRTRPDVTARVARWGSFGEHLETQWFGQAATSLSMASGTGLFDQARCTWDPEALAIAGIERGHLFPLVDRRDARRALRPPWADRWPRLRGVPWFPAIGDGAASNVGSDCVRPDRIALNVGTSAALRLVTRAPGSAVPGLWHYRVDRDTSIVGGATSEGGNVHAWCRDVLRLPPDDEVERALATREADGHGLTTLPFVAGERAPGWRDSRRAVIAGLSLDTSALDILHAALEAVALRLALIYERLAPLATSEHLVSASGGAIARSPAWRRMIADALGRPLHWSPGAEATSRGAARLALEALGVLDDLAETPPRPGEVVRPDAARHARYVAALARQRALDDRV